MHKKNISKDCDNRDNNNNNNNNNNNSNSNPLSFVHLKLLHPAFAVTRALDFTDCYDITKVHFDSEECLNTQILILSRIKKWV